MVLLLLLTGFHGRSYAQCAEVTALKARPVSNTEIELQFQAPLNTDNHQGNAYRKYCGSYQVQYRPVEWVTATDTRFGKPDTTWRLAYFGFSDNRTAEKSTSVINLEPGCRYLFRVNTRCTACDAAGVTVAAATLFENPVVLVPGKAEQIDAWVLGVQRAPNQTDIKALRLLVNYRTLNEPLWKEREWAFPVSQIVLGNDLQRGKPVVVRSRILFENGVYSAWSSEITLQAP